MEIQQLYRDLTGHPPAEVIPLSPSGSPRSYCRIIDGSHSMIGCEGNDTDENRTFIYLARHFAAQGLPVPEIIAVAPDDSCYLQQDLGDTSLFDAIITGRTCGIYTPDEIELLRATIRRLPDIQYRGARGLDFSRCYPAEAMDRRMVMWDLNYFKYCFLKPAGISPNEARLEDDFDRMASDLLTGSNDTFMYRDFQSRNVMIYGGEPYMIDFQGGRRGPTYYDVASFLWQAKANIPEALRMSLVDDYIDAASAYATIDPDEFRSRLRLFVLFRTLQVLGAYGFRGLIEKKSHFMESIPYAMVNLRNMLAAGSADRYPYLQSLLTELAAMPRFAPRKAAEGLTVTVMSFSYRKGVPDDYSGNGGGFVFDCRAIHNPGLYDEYKPLTGRDPEVIAFLEERGEAARMLSHAFPIVTAAVERYKQRGFTHLMVCFGCTGGRHRSVYCAEQMAHELHEHYGVNVELIHRERGISETLKAKRQQP